MLQKDLEVIRKHFSNCYDINKNLEYFEISRNLLDPLKDEWIYNLLWIEKFQESSECC